MDTDRPRCTLTICLAAICLAAACSDTSRYRALRFFFDGVPEPGAERGDGEPGTGEGSIPAMDSPGARRTAPVRYYPHPPFRDDQCAACHSADSGQILRTAEQGLCASCHQDVPGPARYVHGPVAVNACLVCHHYHTSPVPRLLLAQPSELCSRCHRPEDLTAGPYHAALEQKACTECHDAHGGEGRFFLVRTDR